MEKNRGCNRSCNGAKQRLSQRLKHTCARSKQNRERSESGEQHRDAETSSAEKQRQAALCCVDEPRERSEEDERSCLACGRGKDEE